MKLVILDEKTRCSRCGRFNNVFFKVINNKLFCLRCCKVKRETSKNLTKNDYYVYAWKDIDTNEVYYVGKGRGERAIQKRYTPYRGVSQGKLSNKKILDKLRDEGKIRINILEDNLIEEEAYELEAYYTRLYKGLGQCKYNKVIGRGYKK